MKNDTTETTGQKVDTEMEEWVVNLITSLVHTAVKALNRKPSGIPDYVETTFRHGVIGIQIRVDFEEFSDSEDQFKSSDEDE